MNVPPKHWYAVHTTARAEKKVKERLKKIQIENYLPLQTVVRLWSDRKKKIEIPIISGYIFVKVSLNEISQLSYIQGISTILKENGIPAVIPETQIKNLQIMVDGSIDPIEFSSEKFVKGQLIRVKSGKLKGLTGKLLEIKDKFRVAIQLDHFGNAITSITKNCIENISE